MDHVWHSLLIFHTFQIEYLPIKTHICFYVPNTETTRHLVTLDESLNQLQCIHAEKYKAQKVIFKNWDLICIDFALHISAIQPLRDLLTFIIYSASLIHIYLFILSDSFIYLFILIKSKFLNTKTKNTILVYY